MILYLIIVPELISFHKICLTIFRKNIIFFRVIDEFHISAVGDPSRWVLGHFKQESKFADQG